jgi:hypothetical protein
MTALISIKDDSEARKWLHGEAIGIGLRGEHFSKLVIEVDNVCATASGSSAGASVRAET